MAWIAKEGVCQICGKPIVAKSARQKYCPECRAYRKSHKTREQKDRENARRKAKRQGLDPDKYKGAEHECLVKGSCAYGTQKHCDYLAITGRSRVADGFPVRGGRCAAYRKETKKLKRTVSLDLIGSWWGLGDTREV